MGETNNRLTETERAIEQRDNSSTSTTSSNSGRGRGRPRGTTNRESGQKSPKVVVVETPDSKDEKKEEKPKRGRPAGNKKPPAKKKSGSAQVDTNQVKMLLLTVSGIIASREGMEIFMLTPEEVDQIAVPLSSIMAKNDGVSAIAGEYADHIALLLACVTIFIPKYLMYKATKPKKEVKKENVSTVKQREHLKQPAIDQAGKTTGSNKRNDKPATNDSPELGAVLYDFVSPTY